MWRKRKQHPEQGHEPAVIPIGFHTGVGDECEAYLAGRLAAYLQERGRPVPPAAWLNQLAHATTAELALLSAGRADVLQPSTWRRAVAYLARGLFERARETGSPIDLLQRELLVPLELELLGDPDAVQLDSADLIGLTLARLYELPERSG